MGSAVASGTTVDVTSSSLGSDATFNFYATSSDPIGNESACSSATVQYVLDTTAPSIPSSLALQSPATTPNNVTTPQIRVSGVANGIVVKLYKNNSCTIPSFAGQATASGATVDVTSSALSTDATYDYYATASDALGNESACSSATAQYVLDTTPPSVPSGLALQNPATSPNTSDTPQIRISGVTNGDVIKLYKNNTCTAPNLMGSGTASGTTIDITSSSLGSDGTYNFYATSSDALGNESACSSATVAYAKDATAPSVPSGLALQTPATSPNTSDIPTIRVSGVTSGDTIKLYKNNTCTAPNLMGSGAASGATIDITSSSLGSDATFNFYATASDALGNESACSSATVAYTRDTTAPSVPSGLALQTPATSPATSDTPTIRISGVTSGDTIKLYKNNTCTAPNLMGSGSASGATIDIASSSLGSDATFNFYATASDALGNESACSSATVAYTRDTVAPSVPSGLALQTPATSPNASDTPTIRISGVTSGDTIKLYKNNTCTAPNLMGSGAASGSTIDIASSSLGSDATFNFYATASDAIGNESACSSATVAYTRDTTAPSVPSGLALQTPASSPGASDTPTIRISGVTSGDTIKLYKNNTCTAPNLMGSGTASGATIDIASSSLGSDATFKLERRLQLVRGSVGEHHKRTR